MIDIRTIDKTNIQNFVSSEICWDNGRDFLLAKDIIIDYTPFEQFFSSINQFFGHSLRILFLYSCDFLQHTQTLKSGFGLRGFFADEFVLRDSFVSVKTVEDIVAQLKDDTRLIIAVGGYEVIETAKLVSTASKLPLALYILTPECDTALTPYAYAYHNGIKDIFIDSVCGYVGHKHQTEFYWRRNRNFGVKIFGIVGLGLCTYL